VREKSSRSGKSKLATNCRRAGASLSGKVPGKGRNKFFKKEEHIAGGMSISDRREHGESNWWALEERISRTNVRVAINWKSLYSNPKEEREFECKKGYPGGVNFEQLQQGLILD